MRRNMRRNIKHQTSNTKHQTSNTKHQTSNIKRESGIGLVEGMIAAFVLVAVMLGMSSQMSALFRSTRSASNMADLTVVKSTIISRVDCGKTALSLSTTPLIATNCTTAGTLVPLLDKNNKVIISNNDTSKTTLGPWTLRATCKQYSSSSYGIEVQAAQIRNPATTSLSSTANDSTTFVEEPMLRKPLSWQNASSYLVSSPGICGTALANPASPVPTSCAAMGMVVVDIKADGTAVCGAVPTPAVAPTVSATMLGLQMFQINLTVGSASSCDCSPVINKGCHWTGSITCPAGQMVMGGGGQCQAGWGGNTLSSMPIAIDTWFVDCCTTSNLNPVHDSGWTNSSNPTQIPVMFATCINK